MVGRTLLQRYRLDEQVGHGGMAVVYRGRDKSLDRDIAVKLLHPYLAGRPEHRRRLAREAQAVARLQHPNILEIFDFSSEESDEAFLVTELIRGPTLRAFALEHPFSPPELAAACAHALAGALAHAHAKGIVHRDLKPENVMIQLATLQPAVKLMDFGIAQILDRDERMTITGSLMGSPAHMAPEIINGEEADERSDIFSLGTILYWLVTGSLPFEGASPGALLKKVLEGDFVDPRVLKPDVSDNLAKVIADALARDREKRIQTATEFQTRLEASLNEVGLTRPAELLAQFLREPDRIAHETRGSIIAHLMKQGDAAASAKKTGRALAAYGRVIAIAPGTPEAGAAREAIDRMNSRLRWRRRAVGMIALGAVGAMAMVTWRPVHAWLSTRRAVATVAVPPVRIPEARADTMKLGPLQVTETAPSPSLPQVVVRRKDASIGRAKVPIKPVTVAALEVKPKPPPTLGPPPTGSLVVKGWPWTRVAVDDGPAIEVPSKPYEIKGLTAGEHKLTFSDPTCCESVWRRVFIDPGAPHDPVMADPLPPKASVVTIVAPGAPSNADVRVDDNDLGAIGTRGSVKVPIGFPDKVYRKDVVVRLYVGSERKAEATVTLEAGQPRTVQLKVSSP